MSAKDDVVMALGTLTAAELAEIEHRAKFLRQGTPEDVVPSTVGTDDFILETLTREMSALGVEHTAPGPLRNSQQYRSFVEKAPGVVTFLQKACPGDRVRQVAVLALGVRLLYEDLTSMGIAVSSRLVMSHIHRVPSVLNKAFPGYARVGMLGWVIRKRKRNVRKK